MRTYPGCIVCFFRQALEAAKISGADEKTQNRILIELSQKLPDFSLTSSPPEMGRLVYRLVTDITRRKDPYLEIKQKSNKFAFSMYNELKKRIASSPNPLIEAVEISIVGNIIDYGIHNSNDITEKVRELLIKEERAVKEEEEEFFNYPAFESALKQAENILYLGDNAGEIVFDRLLIEEIKRLYPDKKITFAVKGGAIINDALMADAEECGITGVARVITNGADAPGTLLSLCSPEFSEAYNQAQLIISKGQGNFETLSSEEKPIFFLLMAKCPVVAAHIGCETGTFLLLNISSTDFL